MEKIFILDAVNYLFRSYYAIGPMTNDKGQSTSAIFGFIRSIKKIMKDFSPKYIVCVFDGPDNKKSRQEVYAEYKMHRKGAPEDLFPQFEWASEFCDLFGMPTICVEGVEADDTMAAVAKWAAEKEDMEVYLCTSDKDLFQMVGKHTYALLAHKDNMIVDEKKVKEMFGVNPDQILDYLSITGDPSDNIPGLPGFGPKTAVDLLQKFKTLDEILKNPEKVPGKKKQQTLIEEQEKALLSRELATLNYNVKIPLKKDFYLLKDPDIEGLSSFYREMKFAKFLQELGGTQKEKELPIKGGKKIEEKVSYNLIKSEDELKTLIKELSKEKQICIDTETTSKHPMKAKLLGIGFCVSAKKAWYIPLNGNIEEDIIINTLKDFFLSSSKISFYGHNIKYDIHILENYDLKIKNICFDTILASYLLNPQHRRHNLDLLTLEYFNKVKTSFKELTTHGKKKILLKDVSIDKVSNYCCEDVDYTCRLKEIFEKDLKNKKLDKILYNIEIPLISILAKMERNGIFLDENKFEKMKEELSLDLKELEKIIFKKAGHKFNINSPKQLSDILFKKLQLPLPKRRKTEYATGAPILEKLASKSDIVRKIIEYRGLQKLLSTYVEALPKQINPDTGRIHPTFNQSVTATGRLSCQDPNLQNIPVKTKEGIKIRQGFHPQEKGWSYIGGDYSQIELRLLAHFSGDNELIRAFKHGEDIHTHTASIVYKTSIKNVTAKMRGIAKAVNFGTLYGQGAYGLSQQINIPFKEAQEFIKTYFERYKNVADYLEKCKKETEKTKIAKTLTGRQRPIFEIDNKNLNVRAAAQRLAINTPLQGTAADLIKLAMIEIDKEITKQNLNGFMILQIHDELIFEVPDTEISIFKKLIKEKMENVIKLKVPLTIDLQVGKNWGEC